MSRSNLKILESAKSYYIKIECQFYKVSHELHHQVLLTHVNN